MVRILIVEDSEIVAEVVRKQLEADSYTIDVVHNGSGALEQLNCADYDLIILDWMLPDISGPEVCKALRLLGKQMPVLMLTARDNVDDKVLGLDAGADDYLVKPFSQMELGARVRALLRMQS